MQGGGRGGKGEDGEGTGRKEESSDTQKSPEKSPDIMEETSQERGCHRVCYGVTVLRCQVSGHSVNGETFHSSVCYIYESRKHTECNVIMTLRRTPASRPPHARSPPHPPPMDGACTQAFMDMDQENEGGRRRMEGRERKTEEGVSPCCKRLYEAVEGCKRL